MDAQMWLHIVQTAVVLVGVPWLLILIKGLKTLNEAQARIVDSATKYAAGFDFHDIKELVRLELKKDYDEQIKAANKTTEDYEKRIGNLAKALHEASDALGELFPDFYAKVVELDESERASFVSNIKSPYLKRMITILLEANQESIARIDKVRRENPILRKLSLT